MLTENPKALGYPSTQCIIICESTRCSQNVSGRLRGGRERLRDCGTERLVADDLCLVHRAKSAAST